ncbi:hypothetical protein CEUSTIGMA_g13100.t1 [Chlamydomonas eustigma]|uniref:Centrosomal protein of 70 kDa n=1 Tax=Chlamydomonas eustigma TaxID=1157962 RepID=A0A250XRK0_9CHLO|nr:hypothetical protein CEUSTIGMA_g13100.t1 [Chlamydomonas eustigma]|eukprot:GAX85685.1 hypothetical protein CEUSTIGMA_g13100.t1 [Chlamydomonas eustigma]
MAVIGFCIKVRYLSEQLRDAQNLIAVKDRQDAWRGPQHLASLQGRVMVSEQKATEIQRQLDDSRASAVNALRGMQARLDVAEECCKVTAEELAVVRAELQGRPTVEETRSLLNEISILERRVMELRNSGPGSSGAAGEDATSLRALQARRLTGGRDMIRRDKEVHRLGLRDVRDLSRDVLVEIVQDACLELEVSEATALPEAIKKLQSVLTAAPKMEEWIGKVCNHMFGSHRSAEMQSSKEDDRYEGRPDGVPEFTLYSILTALPAASHALTASVKEAAEQRDPSCVPQLLVACISALKDTCTMREVLVAISQALSSRSHPIARVSLRTPGDVVNAVRELVALEGSSLSSREAMALAEEALLSSSSLSSTSSSQQRDQLAEDGTAAGVQHNAVDSTSGDAAHRVLAGLVKRFMQLFDCASLEGVLATMNKVYMTFSEQRNFLTELVSALEEVDGIHSQEAPSGLTTIMSRVRTAVNELLALKQRGQQYSSSKLTLETDGEGGTSRTLSKVYKRTDFVHGTTAHGGDTKEEKEICNQIVTILGASNVQQAVILAERLVGRLRRLDSVLPRYQRVASQLFETLRVQGLEDIVPAVLRLKSIISSS